MTPNYGIAFTTKADEADVHATDGVKMTRTAKLVICHICGKNHYANRCPDREDGTQGKKADKLEDTLRAESPPTKASVNLTIGEDWGGDTNYVCLMHCQVTLGQSGGHIKPTWALLDNQSTVDVFSNICFLKKIRKSDRSLPIFSTEGRTTTDLQGDLPEYGTLWFQPEGIVNILSFSKVADRYRVPYDRTGEHKFLVHLPGGGNNILHTMQKGSLQLRHGLRGNGAHQYCRI